MTEPERQADLVATIIREALRAETISIPFLMLVVDAEGNHFVRRLTEEGWSSFNDDLKPIWTSPIVVVLVDSSHRVVSGSLAEVADAVPEVMMN